MELWQSIDIGMSKYWRFLRYRYRQNIIYTLPKLFEINFKLSHISYNTEDSDELIT